MQNELGQNNSNRLEVGCAEKAAQWSRSELINACRAFQRGIVARLVEYPTGLKMMRFGQPFAEFGMSYECTPEQWASVVANNGKC